MKKIARLTFYSSQPGIDLRYITVMSHLSDFYSRQIGIFIVEARNPVYTI